MEFENLFNYKSKNLIENDSPKTISRKSSVGYSNLSPLMQAILKSIKLTLQVFGVRVLFTLFKKRFQLKEILNSFTLLYETLFSWSNIRSSLFIGSIPSLSYILYEMIKKYFSFKENRPFRTIMGIGMVEALALNYYCISLFIKRCFSCNGSNKAFVKVLFGTKKVYKMSRYST